MGKKILKTIDFIFNKMLPKKFIVFTVATIIVLNKMDVPSEYWEILKYYLIGGSLITTSNVISKNIKENKDKPE